MGGAFAGRPMHSTAHSVDFTHFNKKIIEY